MAERLRMCLSCRAHKDKGTLKRVVKRADGLIYVDLSGKGQGRGAYICSSDCFNRCKKSRLLNKAFKCEVKNEVYEALAKEFENRVDNGG